MEVADPGCVGQYRLSGVVYVVVKNVLGLDFTNPANRSAKFALFLGMLVVATPIVLAIVAWINSQGETMDIAEQRRRQMLARAARQARIAEQKAG
jgi:type III secretory pathway component EscR